MATTPEQNRTVGKFGEKTIIDKNTFEVKGVDSGTVFAQGKSLAEALALQTQGASGGTPTVAGRPDLYAVEPTQAEKSAGIQDIKGADGSMVTPRVASLEELEAVKAGTLESFNKATSAKPITTMDEAVKETINQSLSSQKETMLNASADFDTQLDLQRGALYGALYEERLTPEDLRWLSPEQQAAVRSGDENLIRSQLAALNTVKQGRKDRAAEEEAKKAADESAAYARLQTWAEMGVLSSMTDEQLQGIADSTGLSLDQIRAVDFGTGNRDTKTVNVYDEDGTIVGQRLIDQQTGETIATYYGRSSDEQQSLKSFSGYGGQCGEFLHTLVDIPMVGNSFRSKMSLMDDTISSNSAQIGDVFVQDVGDYGHIGVINDISVDPDTGERIFTVTESNWNLDERITTDRKVRASEIDGYGRYPSKLTSGDTQEGVTFNDLTDTKQASAVAEYLSSNKGKTRADFNALTEEEKLIWANGSPDEQQATQEVRDFIDDVTYMYIDGFMSREQIIEVLEGDGELTSIEREIVDSITGYDGEKQGFFKKLFGGKEE